MTGAAPRKRLLLYREPSPKLSHGLLTHIADTRAASDHAKALAQWNAYLDVFWQHGWHGIRVDPAEHLPDSVFLEDALVVFAPAVSAAADNSIVLLTNPGADARRPEIEGAAAAVDRLRAFYDFHLAAISHPGTLDGGDIIKDEHARTVYCGLGGRTNSEGIRQLRDILRPYGYVVKAVPMTKALHLKSAATALPDGTVLLHRDLIDDVTVFPSYLEVPEEHGVAVVAVDDHTVVMSSDAPKTADMIRARAYKVITVDIEQFERLEGCVTCLSVRFRRPIPK